MQAAAHIDGGNVYLPLRALGEALGYKIGWSEKDGTVSVSGPGKNIVIDLQNNRVTANGHVYYMSGGCPGTGADGGTIVGDRTYMGAGFFSGNLGLKVSWDRQGGKIELESIDENYFQILQGMGGRSVCNGGQHCRIPDPGRGTKALPCQRKIRL
ncbi:hypothetical protein PTH_2343 [Pelotomaculum thermopropionicum SI]|uniref:Copper amine oxidase-like N-terminal domain-containing protein n=1 Tax=Pelotomaculum thermopropionicum (strain DSM 13744 / JCM 10971 / SI) TaxID=370438 RepID=A5CZR8_PELTS|nr:hypothetical protein PTH_2343 [Pelotomaculum thermopropionicum SI]